MFCSLKRLNAPFNPGFTSLLFFKLLAFFLKLFFTPDPELFENCMSGAEIVFPVLTLPQKKQNPKAKLCSHLSDLIARVALKGVGIVSRTPV